MVEDGGMRRVEDDAKVGRMFSYSKAALFLSYGI